MHNNHDQPKLCKMKTISVLRRFSLEEAAKKQQVKNEHLSVAEKFF